MWKEISYPLSDNLALYPGDKPYHHRQEIFSKNNCEITTSSVEIGLHFGTHTDAPRHFLSDGCTIEKVPLEYYIGKCQVITIELTPGEAPIIQPRHLPPITAPRVLLATKTFDYYQPFNTNFAILSDEACNCIVNAGCCLIGVDTPSLDEFNSTKNSNHLKILGHNIAVIEGLNLQQVSAGEYEMLAIPLALVGLEASPLRVLIRSINV